MLTFHILRNSTRIATETWSQARRQNGRPRCEFFDLEKVYVCHLECLSSSWKRSLGEFTFYQKSATTNSKTIVRCDKEVITDLKENQGVSMIDWHQRSWKRTALLTDREVRLSTSKTYVFSDSVLCMGRICQNPVSAWKEKIEWFMNSSQCRDPIDGKPMEFELRSRK